MKHYTTEYNESDVIPWRYRGDTETETLEGELLDLVLRNAFCSMFTAAPRVLLHGAAGSGKTEFLRMIAWSWATGRVFQSEDLVIFLTFSELTHFVDGVSLADCVMAWFGTLGLSDIQVHKLLGEHRGRTYFLIDEVNCYPERFSPELDHDPMFRDASVLLTCRTSDVGHAINVVNLSCVLELVFESFQLDLGLPTNEVRGYSLAILNKIRRDALSDIRRFMRRCTNLHLETNHGFLSLLLRLLSETNNPAILADLTGKKSNLLRTVAKHNDNAVTEETLRDLGKDLYRFTTERDRVSPPLAGFVDLHTRTFPAVTFQCSVDYSMAVYIASAIDSKGRLSPDLVQAQLKDIYRIQNSVVLACGLSSRAAAYLTSVILRLAHSDPEVVKARQHISHARGTVHDTRVLQSLSDLQEACRLESENETDHQTGDPTSYLCVYSGPPERC